jgi:hypothetical protein
MSPANYDGRTSITAILLFYRDPILSIVLASYAAPLFHQSSLLLCQEKLRERSNHKGATINDKQSF